MLKKGVDKTPFVCYNKENEISEVNKNEDCYQW
jgi:hypothetical protein